MWKNSPGSLLPNPMHVPCMNRFQFFEIGLQEKSANRKKVNPHSEDITIMIQVRRRASRY
jgi:hypothetical protein